MDDMPIRPSKSLPAGRGEEAPLRASKAPASYSRPPNNNNHEDAHGSDALDSLARRYPKRQPSEKHEPLGSPTPLEPGMLQSSTVPTRYMSSDVHRGAHLLELRA